MTSKTAVNINRRNKVAFKTSKPASLELEANIPDRYTPNTLLTDFSQELFDDLNLEPDLSVQCSICKQYIKLDELNDHTKLHAALKYLGFKELPESEEILVEKRKSVLKAPLNNYLKLSCENAAGEVDWNSKVKQTNEAYELIKTHLNNAFDISMNRRKVVAKGDSIIVSNESLISIGSCLNRNEPFKLNMEDNNIVLDSFGDNPNLTYIGTFDGFDGQIASSKCSAHLHLALLYNLSTCGLQVNYLDDEIHNLEKFHLNDDSSQKAAVSHSHNQSEGSFLPKLTSEFSADIVDNQTEEQKKIVNDFRKSFKSAYRQMDTLLSRGKGEMSIKRWSGATCFTCVIENRPLNPKAAGLAYQHTDGLFETWIHIANCGDVEAIVVLKQSNLTKRKYKILTSLHSTIDHVKDKEFLERKGCQLIQKRIKGLYGFTRGLGFHGDRSVKAFLNPSPFTKSIRVEENFAVLVIATKGLWSVLNYDRVSDLVLQTLPLSKTLAPHGATSPSVKAMLQYYYYNKGDTFSRNTPKTANDIEGDLEEENGINETNAIEELTKAESKHSFSVISKSESVISKEYSSGDISTTSKDNQTREQIEEALSSSDNCAFYRKSSRPRTVPHDLLHDRSLPANSYDKESLSAKAFSATPSKSVDYLIHCKTLKANCFAEKIDEKATNNIPLNQITTTSTEMSKGVGLFKANSDIYPSIRRNVLTNENRDLKIDIKELESIDKRNIKALDPNVFKTDIFIESDKKSSLVVKKSDTARGDLKIVQVSEYDIKKASRKLMNDRLIAKRLDFAQTLSERLVTSALMAGSTENITVNCVLLSTMNF